MPEKRKQASKPGYLKRQRGETMEQSKERAAENRRRLLASLDPKARAYAEREFAKLGLTQ